MWCTCTKHTSTGGEYNSAVDTSAGLGPGDLVGCVGFQMRSEPPVDGDRCIRVESGKKRRGSTSEEVCSPCPGGCKAHAPPESQPSWNAPGKICSRGQATTFQQGTHHKSPLQRGLRDVPIAYLSNSVVPPGMFAQPLVSGSEIVSFACCISQGIRAKVSFVKS